MSATTQTGLLNVLILGGGGTVAMIPDPQTGTLIPAKTIEDITALVPSLAEHAVLELRQLENLDSTELNQSHWTRFGMEIAKAIETGKYDGIIFTHGTDTMAYTATAVALILGRRVTIPVIFTGSQLPLVSFGTDARFNLENAMRTIIRARQRGVAEVMIVFNKFALRACRSVKVSEADFIAFGSPAFLPLAEISAVDINFTRDTYRVAQDKPFDMSKLHFQFDRGVVVLDLVPGLEPGIVFHIIESGKCKALILRSLGAGNVPSLQEYSLIPCISQATKLRIPVVVTTKFVGGTTHAGIYGPGRAALDAGAIESGNLTDVATQVKVMWLLAQGFRSDNIQKALLNPVCGEVSR